MVNRDVEPLVTSADSRFDYDTIVSLVAEGARVLDLGCGTGELMERLVHERHARAQGVDLHQPSVTQCISKGLSVFHGDLHEGLADLRDNSFDFAILSRTLQQVADPDIVISEMLRVAPRAIISFPNFAFWRVRLHLLFTGTLPVSPALPYDWYDTPNLRIITISDFARFCAKQGFKVLKTIAFTNSDGKHQRQISFAKDWRGEIGLFLLGRK